jgi:hypothetical protein
MVVPSEFESDPCQGLSDCQRAWLRTGDHIDVDSLENGWEFGDGAVFNYEFDWPCDPGPPGPFRAV